MSESQCDGESRHGVNCPARYSNNQLAPHWRGTNIVPKKDGQELSPSGCANRTAIRVDGATGKDATPIGASRWREGVFLELCGTQDANDDAVGAPDGVEAARAIKLEPDEGSCDVELLLCVKELSWDRNRRDPTIIVSIPPRAGGRGWRARRSSGPTTAAHQKER